MHMHKLIKIYFLRFKYFVWFHTPEIIWLTLASPIREYRQNQYNEKFKSYGVLNPDKTFYVIRKRPPGYGFFANFNHVIAGLIYAKSRNFIPVVDMENYWMDEINSLQKINGTYNSWLYFFEEVSGYSLDEVYRSKNVVLSRGSQILPNKHYLNDKTMSYISSRKHLDELHEVFQEYIKINFFASKYIDQKRKDLVWNPVNTLGISVRGTGYKTGRAGNMRLPELNFIIQSIRDICLKKSYTNLYIMTEDFKLYKSLEKNLKDFTVIPSIRFDPDLSVDAWQNSQRVSSDGTIRMGYKKTLDYLTEVFLLSECMTTVCIPTNANLFMLLINYNLNHERYEILTDKLVKI